MNTAKFLRLALFSFFVISVAGCGRSEKEERLLSEISDIKQMAKDRNIDGLESKLTNDFRGNLRMNKNMTIEFIRSNVNSRKSIGVYMEDVEIVSINGNLADVDATVWFTGSDGQKLPQELGTYWVKMDFRMEGDEWKLASANWMRRGIGTRRE